MESSEGRESKTKKKKQKKMNPKTQRGEKSVSGGGKKIMQK